MPFHNLILTKPLKLPILYSYLCNYMATWEYKESLRSHAVKSYSNGDVIKICNRSLTLMVYNLMI